METPGARLRQQKPDLTVVEELRRVEKIELHANLDKSQLEELNRIFQAEQRMKRDRLQQVLFDVAKLTFDPDEFNVLFMKINTKRDGLVGWNEFISHLLLGFEDSFRKEGAALLAPIPGTPKFIKSHHRHPVNRITFYPAIAADRKASFNQGSYLTCSKDGVINYWSLDMELEKTVQSTCPELKVQPTWVMDAVCLPDVSVICTASTERDIRFYDTSAKKFELRIMISSLTHAVCCLHYDFSEDIDEESKLIMGDMGGNVKVILFSPIGRGPFKSTPGIPMVHVRYEQFMKGAIKKMRMVEINGVHTDWVRQVAYYRSLHCIVSISGCSKQSMFMRDIGDNKTSYSFVVNKGFWSFCFCEESHVIATGGPDCLVRVWNPFVPSRPNAVLVGHHSGIIAIILQDEGKKLCSIGKDKCVKVWDVPGQVCLQTYLALPSSELGERTDLTVFYNPFSREIFVGSKKIAIFFLTPLPNAEHTDGNTHSRGVSVVLYNPLFKLIITCGLDSFIIVWDPWDGRRLNMIKNAHIKIMHGEIIPLEITAATFDPDHQLLITGATDGTLKIWNFNTATCIRNMGIEPGCEVSEIVWIKNRILAIGWNRHVVEFADTGDIGIGKVWDTRHSEDVTCAAARVPQSLVTTSYNGELVFWRLETGQPYKQFNIGNPTARLKLYFKAEAKQSSRSAMTRRSRSSSRTKETLKLPGMQAGGFQGVPARDPSARSKRISVVQIPQSCVPLRSLAAHAMIFLCNREMSPDIGTLLIALENGVIQMWSHHPSGGFLTAFSAIHTAGDYVISLATDKKNEFLFTGHASGYIKAWLMVNYGNNFTEHICMPKYRIMFPFMWKTTIEGRASRANRGQILPVLLNSYKAHLMSVSGLEYIDTNQILISCSVDCSVRLWTLGGRYIGTLGSFKPWPMLIPDVPPGDKTEYSIPADLKRVASSTTYKVFMGGIYERKLTKKQLAKLAQKEIPEHIIRKSCYGKRLDKPLLGKHFSLPGRTKGRFEVQLDSSMSHIPVYCHLILPEPAAIPRPSTPENITDLRATSKTTQKSGKAL